MNLSQTLLTELKAAHGLRSNYMAAKLLGISDQAIHKVDKKGKHFSDDTTAKIANLLDQDPAKTVIQLHIETSTTDEMRLMWKGVLDDMNMARTLDFTGSKAGQVA